VFNRKCGLAREIFIMHEHGRQRHGGIAGQGVKGTAPRSEIYTNPTRKFGDSGFVRGHSERCVVLDRRLEKIIIDYASGQIRC